MIIVEGMDNTGKTTLVRNLAEQFQLEMRHSASDLKGSQDLLDWVDQELEHNEYNTIYDRWPLISEEVYGPVLRGKSVISLNRYDGWTEKPDPLFIYCRPSLNKILNFHYREQMEGVKTNAKALVSRYDHVMVRFQQKGWGVVQYDYADLGSYAKVKQAVAVYLLSKRCPEEITW